MADKCSRKWQIPFSEKIRISPPTIRRWIRLYKNGGLEALHPRDRTDQGGCRVMDEETCCHLLELRKKLSTATVPQLIDRMRRECPWHGPSQSTVYRFLHQRDMMRFVESNPADRRKFEAELPNDLQSDVMHGPFVDTLQTSIRMDDLQRRL